MKNHSRDSKSILLRVLLYLFVILVVLVTLYPYFVMFTTAAKSRAEIYSPEGTLLPIQGCGRTLRISGHLLLFPDIF